MLKILITIALATGLFADQEESLECIDGHLYMVIKFTKYELIKKNGCKNGKIELEKEGSK